MKNRFKLWACGIILLGFSMPSFASDNGNQWWADPTWTPQQIGSLEGYNCWHIAPIAEPFQVLENPDKSIGDAYDVVYHECQTCCVDQAVKDHAEEGLPVDPPLFPTWPKSQVYQSCMSECAIRRTHMPDYPSTGSGTDPGMN